jgi:hypothetical protein
MRMQEDSIGSSSFFNYSEPRKDESDGRLKEDDVIGEVIKEENKE